MSSIAKIPVPPASVLAASLHNADFADCYLLPDPWPQRTVLQSYLDLAAVTPGWMNMLLQMRNQVVRLVGLKHLGSLPAQQRDKPAVAYRTGDRIGIFTLEQSHANEVVVGDKDKHLHVRLSLLRLPQADGGSRLALSTVVHEHNRLGRVYMWVVGPVHGLIVPLMLRQVLRVQPR